VPISLLARARHLSTAVMVLGWQAGQGKNCSLQPMSNGWMERRSPVMQDHAASRKVN
jgi:hypothetical protein